jgi:spore maturation protein CgeB
VWPANVIRHDHVPPPAHPAFYCSSPLTLNVTRGAMAELGFCPSGRLFEAAACGVPVLSDIWPGLDTFFAIGDEILTATTTDDALAILALPHSELARVGQRARERVLAEHSGQRRAAELIAYIEGAAP